MKNLILSLVAFITILAVSCTKETPQAPIEKWTQNLMEKYPNFRSNDITAQIVADSIKAYSESFVGKKAGLFDGLEFTFEEMLNSTGDTISVMMRGRGFAEIESNVEGAKYISESICCLAVGNVTKEVAANLSSGYKYAVSGRIKELDMESSLFKAKATIMLDDFYFGTFFVEDMQITKLDEE